MAATGNGTTEYLATANGSFSPLGSYSYAFWYFPLATPSTGDTKTPFNLTNSTGGGVRQFDLNFAWDHPTLANTKAATHRNADLSFTVVQISASVSSSVWMHIAVTFNGSLVKVYYNGRLDSQAAGTNPVTGSGNPELSVLVYDQGIIAIGFDDASIAEVGIWNVALTDAQIFELYCGKDPSTQGSPIFYDPLNSGVATPVGPVLTNHGATFNTAYFVNGLIGGPAAGGAAMTAATAFSVTMDGGPAIGGANMTVASLAFFMDALTVTALDSSTPVFNESVVVTDSFLLPVHNTVTVSAVQLRSKFSVASGPLATNRSNAFTTR